MESAMSNGVSSGVFPSSSQAVSEWIAVKLTASGNIFVNQKQMSLVEFSAECKRLAQIGGAAVLYMEFPANHTANPTQMNAYSNLVSNHVPMKLVQTEHKLYEMQNESVK